MSCPLALQATMAPLHSEFGVKLRCNCNVGLWSEQYHDEWKRKFWLLLLRQQKQKRNERKTLWIGCWSNFSLPSALECDYEMKPEWLIHAEKGESEKVRENGEWESVIAKRERSQQVELKWRVIKVQKCEEIKMRAGGKTWMKRLRKREILRVLMHVCVLGCAWVFACWCMGVCMRVCVCERESVWVSVCWCVCVHVYGCTH